MDESPKHYNYWCYICQRYTIHWIASGRCKNCGSK